MTKEGEKAGFFAKLFGQDGEKKAPVLAHTSMPTTGEAKAAAAMADIGRKSALVKNSMSTQPKAAKSTDLMGELADDFHRLTEDTKKEKEEAEAK